MLRGIVQYFTGFIFFVALQVFILNKIQLSGYINPFMYIAFILLLPFETPRWLLLFVSFFLGSSIDIFTDTLGMHASATLFIGFLRPYILKSIAPREGYETASMPRIKSLGPGWFIRYTLILTLLHHFFLFSVEIFRVSAIFFIFGRTILSVLFTTFLIAGSQYFIYKR